MDEPICECGHVRDEHVEGCRECEVEGCKCLMFDKAIDKEDQDE